MVSIPSFVQGIIPALLIKTSSPFPAKTFSASATAFLMLASLVVSSGMKTARPEHFAITSVKAGDSERAVAKMVDGMLERMVGWRGGEISWLGRDHGSSLL
jgi:hypothetical protein